MQLSRPVRALVVVALALAACRQPAGRGDPTGVAGVRIDADTGALSLDTSNVARVDLACAPGRVAQRTAEGWECREPAALAPLAWPTGSCNADDVLLRTESGWRCSRATDPDVTPILVSCNAGAFVRRASTGWECAPTIDTARTPVLATCPSGRFVGRGANGFSCADPVDPATTPVLVACDDGQHVLRTLDGWACARVLDPVVTPVVESCAAGTWVRRAAGGWSCAVAVDPAVVPVVDACPAGRFVRAAATGWTCAATIDPASTPVLSACLSGTFVRFLGNNAWGCAATIDATRTPVLTSCAEGRFVRRNAAGTGWECSGAVADTRVTPVLDACAAGRLVRRTATGWDCVVPPPDVLKTPVITGCVSGRWVRRSSGAWSCETLSGALAGNVTGNLTGDVTGNVTGDVTGNASGTAQGLRGFLLPANGGTGLATVPTGQLLRSTGTAYTPFAAPVSAGALLVTANGTAWSAEAPSVRQLTLRGLADRTLYVRSDGNDAQCTGLVDAPSTSTGNCALATLQAAVDRIDAVGTGDATILMENATYRVAVAGAAGADLSKRRGKGTLTIDGQGAILSGATAGAPTVAVAATGLSLAEVRSAVVVKNLTIERFISYGVNVVGADATLDGVTIRNIGYHGVFCARNGRCNFSGGTPSTIDGAGSMGIYGRQNAAITGSAPLTIRNSGAHGIYVDFGANATFGGSFPLTVRDSAQIGLAATLRATIRVTAPISVLNNGSWGIYAGDGGRIDLLGGGTITNGRSDTGAIVASNQSQVRLEIPNGQALAVSCESGTASLGMLSQLRSSLVVTGDGSFSLSNCTNTIVSAWRGSFIGAGTGTRTIAAAAGGAADGKGFYVSQLSVAVKGGFPTVTNCETGSTCQ